MFAVYAGLMASATVILGALQRDSKSPGQQPGSNETFNLHYMASGFARDGTMLSMNTYDGSQGHRLTITHSRFPSPEAAKAELHHGVAQAERVLSDQARGRVSGERAVAFFAATKSLPRRAALLLTEGPHYYEVSSPSLQVVLDFEDAANRSRFGK